MTNPTPEQKALAIEDPGTFGARYVEHSGMCTTLDHGGNRVLKDEACAACRVAHRDTDGHLSEVEVPAGLTRFAPGRDDGVLVGETFVNAAGKLVLLRAWLYQTNALAEPVVSGARIREAKR